MGMVPGGGKERERERKGASREGDGERAKRERRDGARWPHLASTKRRRIR